MTQRKTEEPTNVDNEPASVDNPLSAEDAIAAISKTKTADVGQTAEKDARGFVRVFDKRQLVGKPFTIVDWEENLEEFGWLAIVHIVTTNKKALFFKDGSTGVYQQLQELRKKQITNMISCPKGLRVSVYPNPTGFGDSQTFYLDESSSF